MPNGNDKHVTIRVIAERVGVAPCTVSAVLSGRAEERRVGAKTQRRVLAAARKLDYTPNALARELRKKQSGIVGVMLADFTNNWSDRVMSGMEPVLERAGKIPFIAIHRWSPAHDAVGIDRFMQRRVDGIICTPLPENASLYEDLRKRGVPLVFLGDTLEAAPRADFVAWDSPEATRTAVRHLLGMGRRRIAMLHQGLKTRIGWHLRAQAFREELESAGAPMREEWRMCVYGDSEVEAEMRRVFEGTSAGERPNAIYANNDGLAFGALAALRGLGLRVPEDVAVVGMGDLPRGDETGAGLTSAREPCEELGRLAAEIVLEAIAAGRGASRKPRREFVPGTEFHIRKSTCGGDLRNLRKKSIKQKTKKGSNAK